MSNYLEEGKMPKFYTREFKMNAVRLLETSGRSISQVARDLGISSTNLHRWRNEYTRSGNYTISIDNHESSREELQKLKIEVEILKQERDILKRAFYILSRENR